MKKAKGPYMQKPGRGPMMKTGRGIPQELTGPLLHEPGHGEPAPPKGKVDIPTAGVDEEPYTIRVSEGSAFDKLSKELGGIPNSYRNIKGLKKSNDPLASHITPERKSFLMDSLHQAEMKRYKRKN